MNANKKASGKYRKNIISNINSLKDSKYSSMFVVVSFIEQTIVLEFINDIFSNNMLRFGLGFASIILMCIACYTLHNKLRVEIESRKHFPESENDKLLDCATMLGYASPVLCIIAWIFGYGMLDRSALLSKWFLIGMMVVVSIVLPLTVKKKVG